MYCIYINILKVFSGLKDSNKKTRRQAYRLEENKLIVSRYTRISQLNNKKTNR